MQSKKKRLDDLIWVGKTWKRLQQVGGYCFQQNYSGELAYIDKRIQSEKTDLSNFASFINKIHIKGGECFEYFLKVRSKFLLLKQITIQLFSLNDIIRLKMISVGKLEVLRTYYCELSNDFHEIGQLTKSGKFEAVYRFLVWKWL